MLSKKVFQCFSLCSLFFDGCIRYTPFSDKPELETWIYAWDFIRNPVASFVSGHECLKHLLMTSTNLKPDCRCQGFLGEIWCPTRGRDTQPSKNTTTSGMKQTWQWEISYDQWRDNRFNHRGFPMKTSIYSWFVQLPSLISLRRHGNDMLRYVAADEQQRDRVRPVRRSVHNDTQWLIMVFLGWLISRLRCIMILWYTQMDVELQISG